MGRALKSSNDKHLLDAKALNHTPTSPQSKPHEPSRNIKRLGSNRDAPSSRQETEARVAVGAGATAWLPDVDPAHAARKFLIQAHLTKATT